MKGLVICGKSNSGTRTENIRVADFDLWMLGTDSRAGADRYFELHGIKSDHPNTVYVLPDEVYNMELPVNCSIAAMLIYAYLNAYTDIVIKGAPMNAKEEYIQQKPSVAYIAGWLKAKGVRVTWIDGLDNLNYGKSYD